MAFTIIAGVALALGVATSERARKASKRAARVEAKTAAVSNRRERIRALAQGRVARAQQISAAETSGVSAGTGLASAVGSTQSQTFANVGFQQQLEALNNQRVGFLNKAALARARSGQFKQLSSIASFAGGGSGSAGQDLGKFLKANIGT